MSVHLLFFPLCNPYVNIFITKSIHNSCIYIPHFSVHINYTVKKYAHSMLFARVGFQPPPPTHTCARARTHTPAKSENPRIIDPPPPQNNISVLFKTFFFSLQKNCDGSCSSFVNSFNTMRYGSKTCSNCEQFWSTYLLKALSDVFLLLGQPHGIQTHEEQGMSIQIYNENPSAVGIKNPFLAVEIKFVCNKPLSYRTDR